MGRLLESTAHLVDEIIVLDTGSQDRTKEVAAKYGAKVFDFDWIDDFSAARNEAFAKATQEYILWLDADDVLLPEDQEKFLELKRTLAPNVDYVSMLYNLPLMSTAT